MAKRLLTRSILISNSLFTKHQAQNIVSVHLKNLHTNEVPVKEIEIPVQWGHISGKLWGNENERPILALHGWQDNAGTWDPVAPLLAKNRPILAIDFPGHGLSSWIPPGMHYFTWDLPRIIMLLKEHYKWDKISLMCHSMGSIAGLRYASLYPEDVDFYIAVDILVSEDYDLNLIVEKYPKTIKKISIAQTRLNEEPPSYSIDEMVKVWHQGTRKSVSLESAYILLKRGSKQSKHDPNKYYFSRDPRLKYTLFTPESKPFVEALVKRLKCPTLYFKAIDSPYAADEFSVEMREVIANNNENFECHFLPGTHHIHLNNPELVMPYITKFLQKYNFLNK